MQLVCDAAAHRLRRRLCIQLEVGIHSEPGRQCVMLRHIDTPHRQALYPTAVFSCLVSTALHHHARAGLAQLASVLGDQIEHSKEIAAHATQAHFTIMHVPRTVGQCFRRPNLAHQRYWRAAHAAQQAHATQQARASFRPRADAQYEFAQGRRFCLSCGGQPALCLCSTSRRETGHLSARFDVFSASGTESAPPVCDSCRHVMERSYEVHIFRIYRAHLWVK